MTDFNARDEAAIHARSVNMLAGAAILVSLTAPFWIPSLLGSINIGFATERLAERTGAALGALQGRIAATDRATAEVGATASTVAADVTKAATRSALTADLIQQTTLADLAAALRAGQVFSARLQALQRAGSLKPDLAARIAQIAPYGETGVPTLAALRRDQRRLMQLVPGAEHGPDPMGWARRLIYGGASQPRSALAEAMGQARRHLRDDDLEAAVAVLTAVPDVKSAELAGWLDDAAARLAADALVRQADAIGKPT